MQYNEFTDDLEVEFTKHRLMHQNSIAPNHEITKPHHQLSIHEEVKVKNYTEKVFQDQLNLFYNQSSTKIQEREFYRKKTLKQDEQIRIILQQKMTEEEKDVEFINKKKPVRKLNEYKLDSTFQMVIIYFWLIMLNLIYLIIVPYTYLVREQIVKAFYISVHNPRKIPYVILGLVFDITMQFSYQINIIYMIYVVLNCPDYNNWMAFHWSLQILIVNLVWIISNIYTQILPIEYKIIKKIIKSCHEDHEDLSFLPFFWQCFKTSVIQYTEYNFSDKKQDLFEDFLNLGYLSHILLLDNQQKVRMDMKKYMNLDYFQKQLIYDKICLQQDSQMNQERSEFLIMKVDKAIENDIDNSFMSFGINKPQVLCFSYMLDNQLDYKKEKDNQFFCNSEILHDNTKNHIALFRDARKFLVHMTKEQQLEQEITNSFSSFILYSGLILMFKQTFGFYTFFTYYVDKTYICKEEWNLVVFKIITTCYMIQMVYKVSLSIDLLLRVKLQKLIKNLINFSDHNAFIFSSHKFEDIQKWDITDQTTIASWNQIRKCGILMYNHFTNSQERRFKILAYYLLFILYFFIGLTDKHFFWRLDIPLVNNPIWISVMINDAFLISYVILKRIGLGSTFNDKLKDQQMKIGNMRDNIHQMYQSYHFYYHYEPKETKNDFAYLVKVRVMCKIQQRANAKKKEYSEEKMKKKFQKHLKYLKESYNFIFEEIEEDLKNYPVLFMNTIKSDTRKIFGKVYLFLLIYTPFLYKAIKVSIKFTKNS